MSQLIIGDIHGCYDELQALLDKVGPGEEDEIIAIGDLLDRGPKPVAVLNFFQQTMNATSIRGNHEQKHIRSSAGEYPPRFAQILTRWFFADAYENALRYMGSLPLSLDLPDALVIHGYFEPEKTLEEQADRMLIGTMSAEEHLKKTYERPWYDYYTGDKPLIVGHRDYTAMEKPFIYKDRVFGIDTRCVYGGKLTGLLLPEFRMVSVPARMDHWSKLKARHGVEGP